MSHPHARTGAAHIPAQPGSQPSRNRRGPGRAATEFGFADEEEAFGLQYCHGLGLSNRERPLMSRYHSFEHPVELKEGMVFAIETYWPTADGLAAARIEEEVVVTAGGCELLTRFPADQLYVAGTRLFTGLDLPGPGEEGA